MIIAMSGVLPKWRLTCRELNTLPGSQEQVRRDVGLMEFINEVPNEFAGDDAQEIWTLKTELMPYEDMGVSINESLAESQFLTLFIIPSGTIISSCIARTGQRS